jgi:hypothetical protein
MELYDYRTTISIGFHGCSKEIRDKLILNPADIKISKEKYDWLGSGFYIWENNYTRAWEWAKDKQQRNKNTYPHYEPSVVGVVYILGNCLDLTDSKYTEMLSKAYNGFKKYWKAYGLNIPKNKDPKNSIYHDLILRERDCAVINYLNKTLEPTKNDFDTVRGVFTEGGTIYPGAGIKIKTHTQICIRNLDCIKGFFIPRDKYNEQL